MTTSNQTKAKSIASLKTCDLVYYLINPLDDSKLIQAWNILKTRKITEAELRKIAFGCHHDEIALEAYYMYQETENPEDYTIYNIRSVKVALIESDKYLKKQKTIDPKELTPLIYKSTKAEIALVFFKTYCNRYQNQNWYDMFLISNIKKSYSVNRHEVIVNMAFKKLKNRKLFTVTNLIEIINEGYTDEIKIKASQELVLMPNLDFEKLYYLILESKESEIVNVLMYKFILLYKDSNNPNKANMVYELLINENNYTFFSHATSMWNLIHYGSYDLAQVMLLLTSTTSEVCELIWDRFKDSFEYTSNEYYKIMNNCSNRAIGFIAGQKFIDHPQTSAQAIADSLKSSNFFKYLDLDYKLTLKAIQKLKSQYSDTLYFNVCWGLFQKQLDLCSELENEILGFLSNYSEIDQRYSLAIAITAKSDKISNFGFKAYCKTLTIGVSELINLILNSKNTKLNNHCQTILFGDFKDSITVSVLEKLIKIDNLDFRNKFWKMYLKHPEVNYRNILSLAKYSDSYSVRYLAEQTLDTPYYLTMVNMVIP